MLFRSALGQDLPPDDRGQILKLKQLIGADLPQAIEELWSLQPQKRQCLLPEEMEAAIDQLIGANYEKD